jgi:serine/threonine-protein kinase RsbW
MVSRDQERGRPDRLAVDRREGWRRETLHAIEGVVPVVERVVAAMMDASYPDRDVFAIRLALEEAIVNGLRHGNQSDPAKSVRIHYKVRPDCVLVRVEDQGPGFDPYQVPDPTCEENLERCCGRGVFLMRAYMTWVRYNNRGNCVTLCKRSSAAAS